MDGLIILCSGLSWQKVLFFFQGSVNEKKNEIKFHRLATATIKTRDFILFAYANSEGSVEPVQNADSLMPSHLVHRK